MSKPLPKQIQAQADFVTQLESPAPAEPPPVEAPVVEPVPAPIAVAPAPESPREDWEHKYKTLQGIFNSTQKANQQQIEKLSTSVYELNEKLSKASKPATETRPVTQKQSLVTKEDEKAFGADLVDLARRIAKEEFSDQETAYKAEIARLESIVAKTDERIGETTKRQEESAYGDFLSRLTERLPTWEAIQKTTDCQAWLMSPVPGMEFTWHEALVSAAQRRNVSDALTIFNQFFKAFPDHDPKKVVVIEPPAAAALAAQVSPGRTRSGTVPTTPAAKKVYTGAEYVQESQRVVKLYKSGNIKEAEQLQLELDAAMVDLRVRP